MMNIPLEESHAQDFQNLQGLIEKAVQISETGSYSARRPDLGKMLTCPLCHNRRRQFGPPCCNAEYAKTQRAWSAEKGFHQVECDERKIEAVVGKQLLRRIMHKRHGQNRRFRIRQLLQRFEAEPAYLEFVVRLMRVPMPQSSHLPSFAERAWYWLQKHPNAKLRWANPKSEPPKEEKL